jgi:hypothetical protein
MPLAVQIGFAGARRLVPSPLAQDEAAHNAFEAQVADQLHAALVDLPRQLGLGDMHFVVGISQMAAGADLLFSASAARLGWGQRVLLPQQREAYLTAEGSDGPDFSLDEADRARRLMAGEQVIEEVVVTTAPTRADRFQDTNAAILAEADALVCLRVVHREGKVGGTQALIKRAVALEKAVLELVLHVQDDGRPTLQSIFHQARDENGAPRSVAPNLPELAPAVVPCLKLEAPIRPATWPDLTEYAEALKAAGSAGSRQRQTLFRNAASVVVGTHALATLLALLALTAFAGGPAWLLGGALASEVALLLWGYLTHYRLHHGRHAEQWAMARLCAEVGRSVRAYGMLPGTLRYLLTLPMPDSMRPLLRTLIVLHLRAVRGVAGRDCNKEVQEYLQRRLNDPNPLFGQIAYYAGKHREAKRHAEWAGYAFATMSVLAMVATGAKLMLKLLDAPVAYSLGDGLAIAAVMLPVLAVGVLSFTAALDMEARSHTFAQMHQFVVRQARQMEGVSSASEAAASAAETESRLLGETVTWYSRRAYTSIA